MRLRLFRSRPTTTAGAVTAAGREGMREFGYTHSDLVEMWPAGSTVLPVATVGVAKAGLGSPAELGRGRLAGTGEEVRIALGVTRRGRPCVFAISDDTGDLVALWDPAAPTERSAWHEDFGGPTAVGAAAQPGIEWRRPNAG